MSELIKNQSGSHGNGGPKESYVSPSITFTEIEVEQALMGLCKSASGGGPSGMCTLPNACITPGS